MNLPELLKIAEAADQHPLLDKRAGRWFGEHEIANGICEESLNEFIRIFTPSVAIELIKRLQEAEKDAERYRWLRNQHWDGSEIFVIKDDRTRIRLGTYCPSNEMLDTEIDAAMNGGKE